MRPAKRQFGNEDFNRAGRTVWDRTHIVKATGTYLLPGPVGVNLGAFPRVQSGQPLLRWVLFTGYEGLRYGYVYVRAAPRGEVSTGCERYDTVAILDLRAEKLFTLRRRDSVHVYADVFIVFNCNAVTRQETESGYSSGPWHSMAENGARADTPAS